MIAIVGILAAVAIPNLLEARNVRAPTGLGKLCDAARTGSGTAALDSEAAASFHGAPRFVNGRFLNESKTEPYPLGRTTLAAPTAASVILERTKDGVAVERASSAAGRIGLLL